MDPELEAFVPLFPRTDLTDPVAARRSFAELAAAVPAADLADIDVEDRTVPADPPVRVRIYRPRRARGAVVWMHGGGFLLGDLDTEHPWASRIAAGSGAVVISVDYRLAPEHPYPQGVEDAWAALQWVGEHASELGGDPARIAVGGDSAGGNLSAVMALKARDAGGPALVFQLLWYPVAVGDFSLPSFTENADAPILDSGVMAAFLTWYLPGVDMSDPTSLPIELAPANADSLAGLPPAYIGTAEHDPLRDDGGKYAELLAAAGVPVVLSNEPTMVHGYVSLALAAPAAAEAFDRGLAALNAALHPTR